jgi:hypothetical protein
MHRLFLIYGLEECCNQFFKEEFFTVSGGGDKMKILGYNGVVAYF